MGHIVIELPTGDWAEVQEGQTLKIYLLGDAAMAEVRNGMQPGSVEAIQTMDFDVDIDVVGPGGIEVTDD